MSAFMRRPRADAAWHFVGPASSFPDLGSHDAGSRIAPRCRAFTVPKPDGLAAAAPPAEADLDLPGNLTDQVLVFRYKGNFHAVDHQCPHSSFPLSQGSLFDIEDFGIALSAGLTCPKHGWSFDIFSGRSDRGNYRLKVWEVQLRDPATVQGAPEDADKEVWVRRRQRIG